MYTVKLYLSDSIIMYENLPVMTENAVTWHTTFYKALNSATFKFSLFS